MQHANDTSTASLLPEELLILANAHEGQEARRYRLMALRFQPFNTSISRLMDVLVLESQRRLEELKRINKRLFFVRLPANKTVCKTPVGQHPFFILDEQAASRVFERMLSDEQHSRRLYEQLLEANAIPELTTLFGNFVDQKLAQYHILEEARERL
ncbi:hypothetical protein [Halomonas sp. PR-M31]|uniref:hypothetical protein n=1 Tax=Halomonas sp. PR-M31 TaxID=1471202 RepID=UPI000652449B|nr:hypothetical protein [Halomonas sp. PR-M31]